MHIFKHATACNLAAALVAGGMNPAVSAPMPTNVGTMKAMVPQETTQVYWRGGWGWGGWGVGALAGPYSRSDCCCCIRSVLWRSVPHGYPSAYYDPYGYRAPRVAYYGYGHRTDMAQATATVRSF